MASRTFPTGATRDVEDGKLDFEGFLDPAVLKEFARYMHEKRLMSDGSVRDSDNWQQGIPKGAYMKSMLRHVMDVWLHHRGRGSEAEEPLKTALTALMFNVMGYLHETLKEPSSPVSSVSAPATTKTAASQGKGFVQKESQAYTEGDLIRRAQV